MVIFKAFAFFILPSFLSIYSKFIYYDNLSINTKYYKMRNLKIVFPSGSAFDNYKFTIDEDEELEKKYGKDEE